jgi:hypothetical protein
VFHRRANGAVETKKRQPSARLPDRLLAHLRRWERLGIATNAVVEWNGKPVRSQYRAAAGARVEKLACIGRHGLRFRSGALRTGDDRLKHHDAS